MKYVFIAIVALTGLMWGYNLGRLEPTVYTTNKEVTQQICKGADTDSDLIQACRLAKDIVGDDYKTEAIAKEN